MAKRAGSETHKLILEFLLKGQPEKRLAAITKHLRAADKAAQSLLKNLNKLNSTRVTPPGASPSTSRAARDSARAAREEARAAREAQRIREQTARQAAAQQSVRDVAARRLARVRNQESRRAANDFLRSQRAERDREEQTRRTPGRASRFLDRAGRAGDAYMSGRMVASTWRDRIDSLEKYTDAAFSVIRAQQKLYTLRLSPEDTTAGLRAVADTVRQVRGTRIDELTEDLVGLKSVFGDMRQATAMLPTAGKMRFTFQTLFEADPEQLEADILKTMKALEQMGAIRQLPGGGVDTKRFEAYLDAITRIKAYTGGRIGGEEMFQFVGRGGVSAMGVSPEGLMHMASMMEAMGGSAVGTRLMSAFQSFVAFRQGAGGARAADALQRLGLLPSNDVLRTKGLAEFSREGRIKKLSPGALPIADLLGENPIKFADALAKAIKEKGQNVLGRPVDMTNAGDVGRVLSQITGNRGTADLLAKMILLRQNISKDVEQMQRSEGLEQMYQRADQSPMGKYQKFQAALFNFQAEQGVKLLEVVTKLVDKGSALMAVFEQHPTLAKWGFYLLIGGKALTGILETSYHLGGLAGMFSGWGRGAKAAAEGMTAAERSAIGVNGVMGKLNALPKTMQFTLLIASVGYTLYELKEFVDAYREYHKIYKDLMSSNAKDADRFLRLKQKYAEAGMPMPSQFITSEAASAVSKIDIEGSLAGSMRGGLSEFLMNALNIPRGEDLLTQITQGYLGAQPILYPLRMAGILPDYHPFYGADDANKVSLIRQRAPILGADAGVMAEFIRQTRARQDVQPEGKQYLENLVKQAFPQKYGEATNLLAEQSQKASEALNQNTESALKLAPALGNGATAAQSFADRMNAIDLTPPAWTIPNVSSIVGGATHPTTGPGKARGGHVLKGISYPVGERGIELYTPFADGFITPNNELKKYLVMTRALDADGRSNQIPVLSARSADGVSSRESLYVNASTPSSKSIGPITFAPHISLQITGSNHSPAQLQALAQAAAERALASSKDDFFEELETRLYYREERDDERS
ncbi:MAG TPA: hypothetical protein VF543_22380 [Pyrinomonadaceae bacterium]|jgi:hypothetical protein